MAQKPEILEVDPGNGYLKDEILAAFKQLGGRDYLLQMAASDPKSFIGLVAKILPNELKAEVSVNPLAQLMAEIDGASKTLS